MDERLIDLPWLVPPPADFHRRARALLEQGNDAAGQARQLAMCRLTVNELHRLGRPVAALAERADDCIRLGVVANSTVDMLLPALMVSALRHGLWVSAIGTPFDQVAAQVLDPHSDLHRARCAYVLLCLDHRALPWSPAPGDPVGARKQVDDALAHIESLRRALHESSGCTVIVQTVPQVPESLFGSLERSVPGTWQWLIERFNLELRDRVAGSPDLLLDTAALAETIGLTHWHDRALWALAKIPFAADVIPIYAEHVARLLAAARGKARKCLVLDLDNTLWGGAVGDDGLGRIVLGNGSPAGEAHLRVQQTARALRERGVVLAVCSKNEERTARLVFSSHPEMLLREQHIAVFQANWQDKAANLRAIAAALNIGTDALVLLDDSPAERAQVRQSLPEVAVPELPEDPVRFADTLLAAGYFDAVSFTAEDSRRAEQYQARGASAALPSASGDLDSYLRSLQMRMVYGRFDGLNCSRVTQLINKTNQFNLTTRRYTQLEVEEFGRSATAHTLQARLIDRFGDNGIVAVAICLAAGRDWHIDTWLMSCRVLNRRMEEAILNCLVRQARARAVSALIGRYRRTERNGIVAGLYARLGFEQIGADEGGDTWRLDVATYAFAPVPIEVEEAPALAQQPVLVSATGAAAGVAG